MSKKKTQGPEADPNLPLSDILANLGVGPDVWDYVLIGDGSGSTWARGIGWGSILISRETGDRFLWHGAANLGTVNVAEIMAYVQPLLWLAATEDAYRKAGGPTRALRVFILTDSEYCRDRGNAKFRGPTHAILWSMIDAVKAHGIRLKWHWVKRESIALNCLVDQVSRLARQHFETYNALDVLPKLWAAESAYTLNPL
jgi:ribonuclease HI